MRYAPPASWAVPSLELGQAPAFGPNDSSTIGRPGVTSAADDVGCASAAVVNRADGVGAGAAVPRTATAGWACTTFATGVPRRTAAELGIVFGSTVSSAKRPPKCGHSR